MKLGSGEARNFRIQQIQALHAEGYNQKSIAQITQCSQVWVSKVLRGQHESLRSGKRKVAALQGVHLAALALELDKGARAAGFPTDNWTRQRVADVILRHFQVKHHPAHVSRILAKMNYTRQKPQRVDYRQDTDQVRIWKERTLPEAQKKPGKKDI